MSGFAIRLPWFRRGHIEPAELIASLVDFEEALKVADPDEAKIITDGRESPSPIDQIGAAVAARLVLAKQMGQAELVRYVQHLQNRYRAAVGPTTFARYSEGAPHDVFTNPDELKAELHTLSYRLRLAYAITYVRDRHAARIRHYCWVGLLTSLAILFGVIAVQQLWLHANYYLLNYFIVAMAGLGGSLTSVGRRADKILASSPLEDDPIVQSSALQQGRSSLLFAVLTGPVFALIMLLTLLSGAITVSGLTPAFHAAALGGGCAAAAQPTPCGAPDFRVFAYGYWLNSDFDGAKLLIFAFVAGFFEQLVPDVLDRFSHAAEAKTPHSGSAKGS